MTVCCAPAAGWRGRRQRFPLGAIEFRLSEIGFRSSEIEFRLREIDSGFSETEFRLRETDCRLRVIRFRRREFLPLMTDRRKRRINYAKKFKKNYSAAGERSMAQAAKACYR
jgi:hypothetical protein